MNASTYALIVSAFSLIIAFFALVWNVVQKFIVVKPKLQVSFGLYTVMTRSDENLLTPCGPKLLTISVTNLGPGPVILHSCIAKPRERKCTKKFWAKSDVAILNPIHGDPTNPDPESIGPFSGGLPAEIKPGHVKEFYFPFRRECFVREPLLYVGVHDTYGRSSWCKRRDMARVQKEYIAAFNKSTAIAPPMA